MTWDDLDFLHLRQIARIIRHRYERATGKQSRETVFVATSVPSTAVDPLEIGEYARGHWGIEALHHVRDATLGEDASRMRTAHGPKNTALLRSVALNFLRLLGTPIADARRQRKDTGRRPRIRLCGYGAHPEGGATRRLGQPSCHLPHFTSPLCPSCITLVHTRSRSFLL